MPGNSSNLEREGAEGVIAANMNRLRKEQDTKSKTIIDQRRAAASPDNSRKDYTYERKDDQALDEAGKPVQSAAVTNRARLREGAALH